MHNFDAPTLATQAGVSTETVYHALLQKPIKIEDAEKILVALSQHTSIQLSFDQVDIVTWKDYLLLWVVRASTNGTSLLDEYNFVYARNMNYAHALSKQWLEQRSYLQYKNFTPCPEGFTIGDILIPGHIQAEEIVESE